MIIPVPWYSVSIGGRTPNLDMGDEKLIPFVLAACKSYHYKHKHVYKYV